MVVESRPQASTRQDKHERRCALLRRHGVLRTLNKLAYNWYRARFVSASESALIKAHFFPGEARVAYVRDVPTQTVANINDAACREFIRAQAPDVLAVCGTSVIRPEVFTLARRGAVNLHTGITPEYRSADPIFWALYCSEPDKVGVTVHFVDRGIDTGPVIHQESVPVYAGDSLATLQVRCIRRGAALLLQALAEIAAGSVRTLPRSGVKGRAFRSIDLGIVQYLFFRSRFRRLARRLPQQPEDVARQLSSSSQ